jgi:hypothetical protein
VNSPRGLAIIRRNVVETGEVDPATFKKLTRTWFTLQHLEEYEPSMTVAAIGARLTQLFRGYPINSKQRFQSVAVDCDDNSIVVDRLRDVISGSGIELIRDMSISQDGRDKSTRQQDLIMKVRMAIEEGEFEVDETRFDTRWRDQLSKFDDMIPWRPADLHLAAAICLAFWHVEREVTGWGYQPGFICC